MHAEYCNYCSIAIFLAFKTFWTSKHVTLSFNKRSLILLPRASKVVEYPMQWNTVDTEILNLIFLCPKPKDCPKFTIHNTHVWFLLAKCEQSYCNNTSAQQHYKSWHIDRNARHDIIAPICASCHIIVLCTFRVESDNGCSTLESPLHLLSLNCFEFTLCRWSRSHWRIVQIKNQRKFHLKNKGRAQESLHALLSDIRSSKTLEAGRHCLQFSN